MVTECSLNEEKVFEVYKVGWSYGDDDEFFEADTAEEFLEDVNNFQSSRRRTRTSSVCFCA